MKRSVFKLILVGVFLSSTHFTVQAQDLEKGDKAPLFTATDHDGKTWNLKDQLGKRTIVLYFYPAAMTGGCTKQACSYRDHQADLKEMDALVVGISGDNPENLKYFREAENLNFPLLSDPDGKIASAYKVPVRDGGSIVRNIGGEDLTLNRNITTARWTYVIDKKGNIVYKNTQVNPEKDTEEVMALIKTLK
jgi:peroxiredoxin Q/BCP